MQICQVCNATAEDDDVIVLEGRRVCVACKPLVVQQLKEGCLPPVAEDLSSELAGRELPFLDIVKMSWRLFRKDWLTIVALELLVAIPINLILVRFTAGDEFNLHAFHLNQMLESFIGVLAVLGIMRVVSERVQGRSMPFGAALLQAVRRWPAGMATNFFLSLVVGVLLLLLIVPGVIYLVLYTFAICAVALRECSGTRALSYSKSLVQGRWWRVLWKVMGFVLVPCVPVALVAMAMAFLPESQALSVGTEILFDVIFTYYHVAITVLFLNLDAVERQTSRPPARARETLTFSLIESSASEMVK